MSVKVPRDLRRGSEAWFESFARHWLRNGESDIEAQIDSLRRNCQSHFTGTVTPPPFQPPFVDRAAILRRARENMLDVQEKAWDRVRSQTRAGVEFDY